MRLQSSGSSVQLPLRQSEAPMAEHWPMQLVPWPQVTSVKVAFGEQQGTSIDSLKKVKEESKKSTLFLEALPSQRAFRSLKLYLILDSSTKKIIEETPL